LFWTYFTLRFSFFIVFYQLIKVVSRFFQFTSHLIKKSDQFEPHILQIMASSETKLVPTNQLVTSSPTIAKKLPSAKFTFWFKMVPVLLTIVSTWPVANSNFLQMWYRKREINIFNDLSNYLKLLKISHVLYFGIFNRFFKNLCKLSFLVCFLIKCLIRINCSAPNHWIYTLSNFCSVNIKNMNLSDANASSIHNFSYWTSKN